MSRRSFLRKTVSLLPLIRDKTANGASAFPSANTIASAHTENRIGIINILDFLSPADLIAGRFSLGIARAQETIHSQGGEIFIPPGTYLQKSETIEIYTHLIIRSNGANLHISHGAPAPFRLTSCSFELSGLAISSEALDGELTQLFSGESDQVDDIYLHNLEIESVGIKIASPKSKNNPTIQHVHIEKINWKGNYGNKFGSDKTNMVELRGIDGIWISRCAAHVVGIERFLKISRSCRKVHISENHFECRDTSIGKQAIDLFSDTRDIYISNNTFNLQEFTSAIEEKVGGGMSKGHSEPDAINVSNNNISMWATPNHGIPISFTGSWGLPNATLQFSKALISNNDIRLYNETESDSPRTFINVRGFNFAQISGGSNWRDTRPSHSIAVEASNCEEIQISNIWSNYGNIFIGTCRSHAGGEKYQSPPKRVQIIGCMLSVDTDAALVKISGTGQTISLLAIYSNLLNSAASKTGKFLEIDDAHIETLLFSNNPTSQTTPSKISYLNGASIKNFR